MKWHDLDAMNSNLLMEITHEFNTPSYNDISTYTTENLRNDHGRTNEITDSEQN